MKKMLVSVFAIGLSFNVFSATSGTLILKGQVSELLSITVTPETIAASLPLDASQSDTKVATVNEKSNSSTGYKVSVASANKGKLVRTGGSETFAYSLKYNGNSVNLASTQEYTFTSGAAVDTDKDVTISYTGQSAQTMVAGEYSDTLTFTIAAN